MAIAAADDPTVESERHGSVLLLRLNRPARRNAFDLGLMYGLGSALVTAAADDDVSVLILAACGPVLSAGVDLKAYAGAMASAAGPAEINAAAQAGASAARPGLGVWRSGALVCSTRRRRGHRDPAG